MAPKLTEAELESMRGVAAGEGMPAAAAERGRLHILARRGYVHRRREDDGYGFELTETGRAALEHGGEHGGEAEHGGEPPAPAPHVEAPQPFAGQSSEQPPAG